MTAPLRPVPTLSALTRENKALRERLAREAARVDAERRRADAAELVAKKAFEMATWRPAHRGTDDTRGEQ